MSENSKLKLTRRKLFEVLSQKGQKELKEIFWEYYKPRFDKQTKSWFLNKLLRYSNESHTAMMNKIYGWDVEVVDDIETFEEGIDDKILENLSRDELFDLDVEARNEILQKRMDWLNRQRAEERRISSNKSGKVSMRKYRRKLKRIEFNQNSGFKCPKCFGFDIFKCGKIKLKNNEIHQRFRCYKCKSRFSLDEHNQSVKYRKITPQIGKEIMALRKDKCSLRKISDCINHKFGVELHHESIHYYLKNQLPN